MTCMYPPPHMTWTRFFVAKALRRLGVGSFLFDFAVKESVKQAATRLFLQTSRHFRDAHRYVCVYVCVCVYMCAYIYVYMYIYTYVYMYVCICIYICICAHTHTHTHAQLLSQTGLSRGQAQQDPVGGGFSPARPSGARNSEKRHPGPDRLMWANVGEYGLLWANLV